MKAITTDRLVDLLDHAVAEGWSIKQLRAQVIAMHELAIADAIAAGWCEALELMSRKPLFIPLRKEYFEAFERGDKGSELRIYGPRWNERTCKPGRYVILSCGYGKHRRLLGRITQFANVPGELMAEQVQPVLGDVSGKRIAVIHIQLLVQTRLSAEWLNSVQRKLLQLTLGEESA